MNLKSFSVKFLQYLPILSAATATLICAVLYILDYLCPDIEIETIRIAYEVIVVTLGFVFVYCFSRLFGYCLRQKIGIYYTYIFFCCIWLRRYTNGTDGIFGDYIEECHLTMLLIGIVYIVYVLLNQPKIKK